MLEYNYKQELIYSLQSNYNPFVDLVKFRQDKTTKDIELEIRCKYGVFFLEYPYDETIDPFDLRWIIEKDFIERLKVQAIEYYQDLSIRYSNYAIDGNIDKFMKVADRKSRALSILNNLVSMMEVRRVESSVQNSLRQEEKETKSNVPKRRGRPAGRKRI